MAQFGGIQGLGGPMNYYNMIPDFRAEALQETQNQLGQQQVIAAQRENAMAQQQVMQQQALMKELPGAMNDPAKLQALAIKYPSQLKNIQAQLGFRDAQDVDATEKAVNALQQASSLGPEAVANALVRHAGVIQQKGATPQQLMQMWVQSPEQFNSFLGTVKLGTLGAKDQFDINDKQQGRAIDSARLAETERSNRAGESVQWANVNIAQQNANIRKMELEDKKYDRQIARETNEVQLGMLKDKQQQNQQEISRVKQERDAAYDAQRSGLQETLDLITDLKTDEPGRYGGLGGLDGMLPRAPGTAGALYRDKVDRLNAILTLDNSGVLKGTLSETDMKLIKDAAGGLRTSMPADKFDARLNAIEKKISAAIGRVPITESYRQRNSQPQTTLSGSEPSQSNAPGQVGASAMSDEQLRAQLGL